MNTTESDHGNNEYPQIRKEEFEELARGDANYVKWQHDLYAAGQDKLRNLNRNKKIGLGLWLGGVALEVVVGNIAHYEPLGPAAIGASSVGGAITAGSALDARKKRKELSTIAERASRAFEPYKGGEDPTIVAYRKLVEAEPQAIPDWVVEGMSDQRREQLISSIETSGTPAQQQVQLPLLRPEKK